MYKWGDLRLDPEACEVSYQGNTLRLYPKEYELLKLFFDYPKRVLSPSFIMDRLWSFDSIPSESAVRAHIKGLRRKLKDAGAENVIQTVHSLGYRLKPLSKETQKSDSSLSPMLIKLLALHEIEHVIVDKNFIILEASPDVKNFSDYPLDVVVGREVTLAFPELIGIESTLLEILEDQKSSFDIKGIARSKNSLRPDYINIYAMSEPTENKSTQRLLLLFEDSSEKMIWKQQVVQQENESYLLIGEPFKS
ncbi:winged helix-turn-helix transcriptional regulator [Microcoleus sp. FACHB-53]|nr:winged helix-turn-helix transcriptional regulator [Microcoleus sp. FACHB-53]